MSDMPLKESVDDRTAISLVSQLVESIVDGVMAGQYVQGQRLIAADLAEQFGVSRAPVREALHVLAGEGVVELLPNRGARIRRLSILDRLDFLEFTEALLVLGVRLATG
jgi:DNA-binding GntR family transcriptional regulator